MYELMQAAAHTYWIECPARIGVVEVAPGEVVLVDAGLDRSAATRVRRILDAHGWHLQAIFATHAHADHIGGASYLMRQTGCKLYCPGPEATVARWPQLAPTLLYGAYPPAELRHKFLMPAPSDAEPLTKGVLPEGWEAIDLSGHVLEMCGYRTPDDVVFVADALVSERTLARYRVPFLFDVVAHVATLARLSIMRAAFFVPAHVTPSPDISALARANMATTLEVAEDICELCADPVCFDDLLAAVFGRYDLEMTFEQHALVGSTVRSYLSYLEREGRVTSEISDRRWLWRRV